MNLKKAVSYIEKHGALLVYPIDNRKLPLSLWHCFFPKKPMKWDWTDESDNLIADLWHLREELSRSKKVAYLKWYQGRATFFSLEMFEAVLASFLKMPEHQAGLMPEAREVLSHLEETSPLSTKELKLVSGLRGKFYESTYTKSLKQLWDRLLIVGCGEKQDGAFPSLMMGATRHIFEESYSAAEEMKCEAIEKHLDSLKSASPLFFKYYLRVGATVKSG